MRSTTPVRRGGRATGARPAEVYCKGAGAAAEYCKRAEECVVGSTTPVRRGRAELQGRGQRKCTVKEQGPQQSTVRGRRSVWWGPQHPSVGGGAELQGRGPRNPTVGSVQVCKVTINCGYRCGRDRVSHLLKFRGRAISAIRYSMSARVYLPVIPSIMIRAPRMVAFRGTGDEWREGRVLLP